MARNIARTQGDENPVYRIQNAHVRASSILKKANVSSLESWEVAGFDYELTKHEVELVEQISDQPVEQAA